MAAHVVRINIGLCAVCMGLLMCSPWLLVTEVPDHWIPHLDAAHRLDTHAQRERARFEHSEHAHTQQRTDKAWTPQDTHDPAGHAAAWHSQHDGVVVYTLPKSRCAVRHSWGCSFFLFV
jgi:hypothetical protein